MMKALLLSRLFKQAITTYTGVNVDNVNFVEDPKVKGTFAIQATFDDRAGEQSFQFLVCQGYDGPKEGKPIHEMTPEQIADILEEVNFSSWPPRQMK